MKRQLLLGALLSFAVAVQAATNDTYTTHMSSGGLGGTVEQRWTVGQPEQRPDGNLAIVAVNVDSVTAASAPYALNVETSTLTGCTAGTFATSTGTTMGIVGRLDLNLVGADCHGSVRFLLTSGSNTARVTARISILSPDSSVKDPNWLQNVSQFAFLLWLIYFVASRLIRNITMQLLSGLVGMGIIALPISESQFLLLATAQFIVLGYDSFRQFGDF